MYELALWLHTLARSLVAIFIPVLMLKSGYSLQHVIFFFLVYNILDVPLNFVARGVIRRIGARLTVALATLATILFYWTFLHITAPVLSDLLLLALLAAVYDSFYWVAHYYLFIETGRETKGAGRSTGTMYAVRQFALLLGPAVGAGILVFFSRDALLYATIAGYVLSITPLLALREFPDKPHRGPIPFRKFFALPHGKRAFLSSVLYAIHDTVESNLFPLFIFLLLGTIESVALIPVILSVTAMGVAFFLGRIRTQRRALAIVIGGLSLASIWMIRLLAGEVPVYYVSVLFVSIAAYFVLVPVDTMIVEHAKRIGDALSASMYRNIAYMGPNIVLYGLLALLLNVFEPSFAFAAVSLGALTIVHVFSWMSARRV
ncbi:MFS transporter [Candidatus Kaiserbacteria bacterium]|nr:MFS transporter [Candidatus Kaiserbacteria bacterium]